MNETIEKTPRTTLRRLPDRGSYDREVIYSILDEAFICHLGFSSNGSPFVIPTAFGRIDDFLYVHGSAASRTLHALQGGLPVCVTVTLVDGLVLARSAFHHSINYRSVMLFGTARQVTETDEKMQAMYAISEHIIRGRWDEVRAPNAKELKATSVLAIPIEECSAKVRTGPPKDDECDYAVPAWAGVLPVHIVPGEPVADPHLSDGVPVPDYVRQYSRRR